jgi:hypothetical protein
VNGTNRTEIINRVYFSRSDENRPVSAAHTHAAETGE